jgi:hypothetical protein
MINNKYFITDIIGEVVNGVANDLDLNIVYYYGDVNEVVQKLNILARNNTERYPAVAMFTDITQRRGNRNDLIAEVTIPYILFCCITEKGWHAEERIENSIKQTLYPIYERFLKNLELNDKLLKTSEYFLRHNYTERLSIGKSALFVNNNGGNDFIDAIEVQNLELQIKRKC